MTARIKTGDPGALDNPTTKRSARERRCIVTRAVLPDAKLVRFARSPAGAVVPDVAAKLPGRGAWVTADRNTVDEAAAKGRFGHAFKQASEASASLSDEVEALLRDRLRSYLSLARKAGEVVMGFDQVRAALQSGPPGLVLAACDGAEDGRGKILSLAHAAHGAAVADLLSAQELGLAFGREHVIHALLKPGRFAEVCAVEMDRLRGFVVKGRQTTS